MEHSLMNTVLENPCVVNGILDAYSSFWSSPSLDPSWKHIIQVSCSGPGSKAENWEMNETFQENLETVLLRISALSWGLHSHLPWSLRSQF